MFMDRNTQAVVLTMGSKDLVHSHHLDHSNQGSRVQKKNDSEVSLTCKRLGTGSIQYGNRPYSD